MSCGLDGGQAVCSWLTTCQSISRVRPSGCSKGGRTGRGRCFGPKNTGSFQCAKSNMAFIAVIFRQGTLEFEPMAGQNCKSYSRFGLLLGAFFFESAPAQEPVHLASKRAGMLAAMDSPPQKRPRACFPRGGGGAGAYLGRAETATRRRGAQGWWLGGALTLLASACLAVGAEDGRARAAIPTRRASSSPMLAARGRGRLQLRLPAMPRPAGSVRATTFTGEGGTGVAEPLRGGGSDLDMSDAGSGDEMEMESSMPVPHQPSPDLIGASPCPAASPQRGWRSSVNALLGIECFGRTHGAVMMEPGGRRKFQV